MPEDYIMLDLAKHKYANAKGADLWDEIGRVSHMPVRKIMESWIGQMGFPLVSAKKSKNRILLQQLQIFA